MSSAEAPEYWRVTEEYEEFVAGEGIPVHGGHYVQDVKDCVVDSWDRAGVDGAFINLDGHAGINDLQLLKIPPNEETRPQQHLHEGLTFVVQGQGTTVLGTEDDEKVFEWDDNALFALPRNTRYRHVNMSDEEPTYLLTETDLPILFSLLRDESLIFDTEHRPVDEGRYKTDGTLHEGKAIPVVWESNFIPDITSFDKLEFWDERGAGGASVQFSHPDTALWSHMSQFPVGTYKKAHRHQPGANVVILDGEGYTLLWPGEDPDERVRIDWQPGTVMVPPMLWYHQHFNTASQSSRYFALHPPNLEVLYGDDTALSPQRPENQIEYVDEDLEIRAGFEATLAERGIENRMPDEAYENADYSFDQQYE